MGILDYRAVEGVGSAVEAASDDAIGAFGDEKRDYLFGLVEEEDSVGVGSGVNLGPGGVWVGTVVESVMFLLVDPLPYADYAVFVCIPSDDVS